MSLVWSLSSCLDVWPQSSVLVLLQDQVRPLGHPADCSWWWCDVFSYWGWSQTKLLWCELNRYDRNNSSGCFHWFRTVCFSHYWPYMWPLQHAVNQDPKKIKQMWKPPNNCIIRNLRSIKPLRVFAARSARSSFTCVLSGCAAHECVCVGVWWQRFSWPCYRAGSTRALWGGINLLSVSFLRLLQQPRAETRICLWRRQEWIFERRRSWNPQYFLLLPQSPRAAEISGLFSDKVQSGSAGLQLPHRASALQTSYYRSYITGLTAAALHCFHFSHECSCAGETLDSSWRTVTRETQSTLGCLMSQKPTLF